jgi:starch synthase (maltosyl-transferring)
MEPSLARVRPPLIQTIDDPHLVAWCRYDPLSGNRVLVVVNMQPHEPRKAKLTLDRRALDLKAVESLTAHDLLDDTEQAWPIDAITITCTPDEPVRVFRLEPTADAKPTTQAL